MNNIFSFSDWAVDYAIRRGLITPLNAEEDREFCEKKYKTQLKYIFELIFLKTSQMYALQTATDNESIEEEAVFEESVAEETIFQKPTHVRIEFFEHVLNILPNKTAVNHVYKNGWNIIPNSDRQKLCDLILQAIDEPDSDEAFAYYLSDTQNSFFHYYMGLREYHTYIDYVLFPIYDPIAYKLYHSYLLISDMNENDYLEDQKLIKQIDKCYNHILDIHQKTISDASDIIAGLANTIQKHDTL